MEAKNLLVALALGNLTPFLCYQAFKNKEAQNSHIY